MLLSDGHFVVFAVQLFLEQVPFLYVLAQITSLLNRTWPSLLSPCVFLEDVLV